MIHRGSAVICLLLISTCLFAQNENQQNENPKKKGTFYFSYGYNKDWFSKSDIHFQNHSGELNEVTGRIDNYDFTVHNVTAKDRPGFDGILESDISVPQYVYRIGYMFGNKRNTGIEINFDHAKYVVNDQVARIQGEIFGEQMDKDTMLSEWFHFEHTNGANFMMINFVKHADFYSSKSGKLGFSAIVKTGAGIVIPKTDVTLFGQRLDNRFHIAGYIAGIETGIHMDFLKHGFLESTFKSSYANYTNVLVIGSGKANHHFFAYEVILTLGLQFAL